ncbi:myb-related transcription factor, partner of profilin-like [Rhinatrema bivittatum]|uniref:myb-related transcription factor, partner of profilin-like n=1 Tax=Rhinatrema bivittatum TaxID=194408 RepID=UPI00112C7BBD|nr:myb-related transcription factor, partner of profilin-like [Rhinatrema bivittatum]
MSQAHPVLIRKPNFVPAEVDMLVEHVIRHRDLLYGPQSRMVGAYRKEQIWRGIRHAVNSVFHHNRSIAELMHKWRDMRRLVKRKQARCLAEGERSHITFSSSEQLILATISEAAAGGVGQLDTMRLAGQEGEPDDEQPGLAPRRPQRLYRHLRVVPDSSAEEEVEAHEHMEQPAEEEQQQRQGEEPEDPLAELLNDRRQDSSASDQPEPDSYASQAERLLQQGAGLLDTISGLFDVVQQEASSLRDTIREEGQGIQACLRDLCRATKEQTEVWRDMLQRLPPVQPQPPAAPWAFMAPWMHYPPPYGPPYPWMAPARAEAPGVVPPPAPQPVPGYPWMAQASPPAPPVILPPPAPEPPLPLAVPSSSHDLELPQAPLPSEGSVSSGRRSPLHRSARLGQSKLPDGRRRGRSRK